MTKTYDRDHVSLTSCSKSRRPRRYDVFLSFRGEDTRLKFVSHLHFNLKVKGIETFLDDEGIVRGSDIGTTLLKMIQESRIVVIVFSKNYPDSSWCLNELLMIMECSKENGLIVYPVFYDVNPSDVRNQTGVFGEAFSRHEDAEKVDLWREALRNVACLAGWDLNNPAGSHEANCIGSIVENVFRELNTVTKTIDENLIGVERRKQDFMSHNLSQHDVGIIGILGMCGSGKTTIAKAVFIDMCKQEQFDGHCFVDNISEVSKSHNLVFLQEQILSGVLRHKNVRVNSVHEGCQKIKQWLDQKKVLIVLDKVDSIEQLEALAGAKDWFGNGSRIIITTTDERLLVAYRLINSTYNVVLLDDEEAIQLFNKYAFKNTSLTKAHEESLDRVIRYAAGHPGALKCLGSRLIDKTVDQWKNTLDSYATCQEDGIDKMLKSSLNGLNAWEKELFLDIACFFNGWLKEEVIDILDCCGLFATCGLGNLKEKSLITFSKEFVHVHNLIQEMGRNIVRQEHPDEPSRQSRLWHPEEVKDVLMENKGTEDIKAIVISNLHKLDARGTFDAFTSMKKLRLLHANTDRMIFLGIGSTCDAVQWLIQGSGCLKYLPCDLRWLTWDYFNLESWPTDFHAKKLVGLQMRHSSIIDLCRGRDIRFLEKLKILDLSFSKDLIRTPDFKCLPHLNKLNLEFCSSLLEVHTSIGVHSSLVYLNLRSCEKLKSFPSSIKMKSLEILYLSGCSKLKRMPDFDSMDNLLELDLSRNSIEELPSTVGDLPSLMYLDISNCRNLTSIPGSIWMLNIQAEIILHGCPVSQDCLVRPS